MEETVRQQLADFIVTHQEDFYRLAYSHVKNRDAALDVVQESIVKALSKADGLRRAESLKPWFYRILINESMNYYRYTKRLTPLEEAAEAAAPAGDHAARLDLLAAIDRLDPRDQLIIRLRFFEEMKLKEIAQAAGLNLNTVKSRLYKGLRKLRELTGEECSYE